MTQARAHSGTVVRDGDTDFRVIGCRKCRAVIVVLYHRDDRLLADIHAPVLDPVHRQPITDVEFLPADDDLPEWRSKYEGLTRPTQDPRGIWFGGIDVLEEIDGDPNIEVTCYCRGAHRVDLADIANHARSAPKNRIWWPVS